MGVPRINVIEIGQDGRPVSRDASDPALAGLFRALGLVAKAAEENESENQAESEDFDPDCEHCLAEDCPIRQAPGPQAEADAREACDTPEPDSGRHFPHVLGRGGKIIYAVAEDQALALGNAYRHLRNAGMSDEMAAEYGYNFVSGIVEHLLEEHGCDL